MNVKVFCSLGGAEFFSRWLISNLFSEKIKKIVEIILHTFLLKEHKKWLCNTIVSFWKYSPGRAKTTILVDSRVSDYIFENFHLTRSF